VISARSALLRSNIATACQIVSVSDTQLFVKLETVRPLVVVSFSTSLSANRVHYDTVDFWLPPAEKGSKKKGSQAGDEDSESAASASTLSSLADLGFDDSSTIEDDPFEASIDALYEKRQVLHYKPLGCPLLFLTQNF